MGRWWRGLVLMLAALYTLGYGIWRILLLTPWYERFWQLRLSEVFGSWSYLPLLPLALLALVTRSRGAALLLLVPLLGFTVEYGGQFVPNWPAPPSSVAVRVLTWNTLFAGDSGGEFQTVIGQVRPDFIAVQEVNRRLVRLFEQDLVAEYPFRALHAIGGSSGLALFSRYPLEVVEVPTQLVNCQCMVVESEINGRRVTLIVVHIWRPQIQYAFYRHLPSIRKFDTRLQTPIFDQLIQQVAAIDGPLLMLGDLNTSERQPNYRRLRLYLQDAFAEAGWGMGYTFPATLQLRNWRVPPFVRIDHILVNEFWQTRAAWSGRLPTSDHGYVVADLGLVE